MSIPIVPTSKHPPTAARTRCGGAIPAVVIACLLLPIGCSSSIRTTDPARTATEQFLLSIAAKRAVDQLSVESLHGRSVFIDATYFAASEQPFVLGELRAKLLMGGIRLVPDRNQSQVVLEVRSGGVGIDRSDFLFGIPSILLRTGSDLEDGGTTIPIATPELAIAKSTNQRGIASIAFIAYWRETGDVVAFSGPYIGWTTRDDWWFLGVGQKTVGDIPPAQTIE